MILDPDFTGLLKDTVILGREWTPEKPVAGKEKNGAQQKPWLQSQTFASWLFYQGEAGWTYKYLPLRIPSDKDSTVLNIFKESKKMQNMQYMGLRHSWFPYSMIVLFM